MTGAAGQLLRDHVSLVRELSVINLRLGRSFRFLRSRFLRASLRLSGAARGMETKCKKECEPEDSQSPLAKHPMCHRSDSPRRDEMLMDPFD